MSRYYCNPLNLTYRYQFNQKDEGFSRNREAADPSLIIYKGKYYLFPSMSRAFASLCRQSPGSQWILPVRPGQTSWTEELMPQEISHISIYPWEVAYDYSRTS